MNFPANAPQTLTNSLGPLFKTAGLNCASRKSNTFFVFTHVGSISNTPETIALAKSSNRSTVSPLLLQISIGKIFNKYWCFWPNQTSDISQSSGSNSNKPRSSAMARVNEASSPLLPERGTLNKATKRSCRKFSLGLSPSI